MNVLLQEGLVLKKNPVVWGQRFYKYMIIISTNGFV